MRRDVFANLSPLDHRYYAGEPQLFDLLSKYLSENAYISYQAKVEAALVGALADRGLCPADVAAEIQRACDQIDPHAVYQEEEKTQHNIRALVNVIRAQVSDVAKPYVHLSATSFDIMDTARVLQYRDVTREVLIPELIRLFEQWVALARREAHTLQIGRTHGQHAVPSTFGFALAEYVSRLGNRIERIDDTAANLRGKMAGAVGAYNASALFFDDPEAFEAALLSRLGLKPATHATQIVEPEYVLDYAHACISCFGVLANFADDMRHLQRTEIGEVGEAFSENQVGSSTMPHKRNPWNFENVKSMWKAFAPRMVTLYMDQISEHQRDLTNSASARFTPEIVVGLAAAARRLYKVSAKLVVDPARMQQNFAASQETIIAEPLYILLSALGHPSAHEAVRQLTLQADRTGRTVRELLPEAEALHPYLQRLTPQQRQLLDEPARYVGIAATKTHRVCDHWEQRLANLNLIRRE